MKRIGLLLSCTPNYGGSFQYCLNMLDAVASLPGRSYRPVVAYIDPVWKEYLKAYRNLEIHTLDLITVVQPRCDLWIFPAQESWDFQKEVPVLSTVHDLMHRYGGDFPEVNAGGIYEQREAQYTHICRWSRGVLVDSDTGRRHVHESYGMPLEKIFVLPYIAPRYICESSVDPGFDKKYDLPSKFMIYPAHFWPHKNHIRLITAVASLLGELPDLQLVLVGSPKEGYEQVVQLVSDLQMEHCVHFMGYVPDRDMPEFYRRARALVMPTCFGPTNIPPLEAFALGCPVAISNIFAIPEQVGDAAVLFDPNSTREIADSIRLLWMDDTCCKELTARGKRRAAKWGRQQFNQRLLEIIKQLV